MFDDLMPDLTTLSPTAVLVTIFVLAFLETSLVVGVFLPGEVLVAAGIGVLHVSWSPLAGVVAAAGCLTGQVVGYLIGYGVGPKLQHGWVGRKTGPKRWAQAEHLVRNSGGWLLITARFVAVAHTLAPVLAGALRMPRARFVGFAALSSLVWAVIWTVVGAALSKMGQAVDHGLISTVLVTGGVLVAAVVIGRVLRHPAEATERAAVADEQPCRS